MTIRLLKITAKSTGYPTELKDVPMAYLDGTMTGIETLEGKPIEVKIFSGKIECDAVDVHASSYSRRGLNKAVNDLFKKMGPQALDALSSTRDLLDDSCFVWDSLRPVDLNPVAAPIVKNGAPLQGHAKGTQNSDPDDEDDDI